MVSLHVPPLAAANIVLPPSAITDTAIQPSFATTNMVTQPSFVTRYMVILQLFATVVNTAGPPLLVAINMATS